jgi:hypothetical protein
MAANAGKGRDWQGIAAANGIEDPLRMNTGQFVDLNAGIKGGAGFGISGGAGIGVSGGAGLTVSSGGVIGLSASSPAISLGTVVAPPPPGLGLN